MPRLVKLASLTWLAALVASATVASTRGEDAAPRSPRPDLEALPLEPEAAFAERLVKRTKSDAIRDELWRRIDESEKDEPDPFRLATVSWLRRNPLRVPGATKALGEQLVAAARPGGLDALVATAALSLDASVAPILTTAAPAPPPKRSSAQAHVDHCVARLRRARDLVRIAFAKLERDEVRALEQDGFTFARKFRQHILLDSDKDAERWKRNQRIIAIAAKVERAPLVQALGELAALAKPEYLDQLAQDLAGAKPFRATSDLGDVILAGPGKDKHDEDAALVIDLGGDDTWTGSAGSARGRTLPVSVAIDLAGNDSYKADEAYAQGSAFMGAGLLVDRKGDDVYESARMFAQGSAFLGAGLLVDLAGKDRYKGETYAQGSILLQGVGALVDVAGADVYEAGLYAQGFAGPGGFGVLVDRAGDDRYVASKLRPCCYGEKGIWDGFSQGSSCGFRHHASGGVAALVDGGGSDSYLAGNFGQGSAYYHGWALLCDLGGAGIASKTGDKDRYDGSRYTQGSACHQALGSFLDDGGDDHYSSRVLGSQAIAWDLSVATFTDAGGDDLYEGGGTCQAATAHNGFALFFDGGGADTYRPGLPAAAGPNDYHGGPSLSVFVDAGGAPNKYADVAADSPFKPQQGLFVSRDRSIFADLPWKLEDAKDARLDALAKH